MLCQKEALRLTLILLNWTRIILEKNTKKWTFQTFWAMKTSGNWILDIIQVLPCLMKSFGSFFHEEMRTKPHDFWPLLDPLKGALGLTKKKYFVHKVSVDFWKVYSNIDLLYCFFNAVGTYLLSYMLDGIILKQKSFAGLLQT